ncbi:MAG TPA: cytochrome c [Ignavibacteriaceae bacterium]|nr:cytochrome c [Ignavibacterium sp.]HMN25945.1 cytochrome c [Ignavibacteriaceae bacterium]HRN27320.1 cytochrome c [Ignavibacteriaceae bacterium]HRP94380.1 cytochrome c [Ignavibacteriaceae bacterium]HRQ54982.1 cytochrome c [Ignavibacteriaceae bacterium]
MKILVSVLVTLISLIVIFLIIVYSGWYNVSAMNEESGIMKWVLNTTRQNSIEARLDNISVPDLNNPEMINEGFEHYNEMCVSCHGAPGKEQTELSKGLNPSAPYLVKFANKIDPRKLFWVTKNGINMTGMPAWGKTHSDEKIWAIVAFMKKFPNISEEEYEKMESESVDVNEKSEQSNENEDHVNSHNEGEHHH